MAKIATTITDKQSRETRFPDREPKPAFSGIRYTAGRSPSNTSSVPRYTLFNQDGEIVATLIDQSLAEKWVANHTWGAIRFAQDTRSV
jgi:hypothetical protein